MRRILGHGRYATVTSTLALIVALSGSAYAANTVRSIDIVDGAVKSPDIRNGTIVTADVAAASLGRSPRLWAQVGTSGNLIRGTVSSATRTGVGTYDVSFPRNVEICAISESAFSATPVVTVHLASASVVTVRTFDETGAAVDASFDIIAVC